jgi:hypothetical protein
MYYVCATEPIDIMIFQVCLMLWSIATIIAVINQTKSKNKGRKH